MTTFSAPCRHGTFSMVRARQVRRSGQGEALGEHIDFFLDQMIGWLLPIDDFDADHQTRASDIAGQSRRRCNLAKRFAPLVRKRVRWAISIT
jgi:hypothetical protein